MFCTESQNNWPFLLKLAQFAYNNLVHESTKTTPFYAVYGKHPLISEPPADSRLEGEVLDAVTRIKRMHSVRATLKEHLRNAQEY
jgi:hypothetical protein